MPPAQGGIQILGITYGQAVSDSGKGGAAQELRPL